MKTREFIDLLENPAKISAAHARDLEKILVKAPYFQAARALRLKGLKEGQSFSYNSALKKTAAYTTDRSILFDFITSPEFNQNKIAAQIKEHGRRIEDIPVFDAEVVSGKRSIAIDEAIKMKQSESEQVMDPSLFERASSKKNDKEEKSPEEELEMGKPLEFESSESHSFSEWLQLTSSKPVKREEETPEKNTPQSKKFKLIEDFISNSPKIKPGKPTNKSNLAEQQSIAPESLMTETLAKVYLEQKNYKKAIQAYKILILKNPEKSGFFADQIRAIEKLQEKNTDKE